MLAHQEPWDRYKTAFNEGCLMSNIMISIEWLTLLELLNID